MTDILTRAKAALEGTTKGPWAYRPQKYDDWGVVRGGKIEGEDGWLGYIYQAKDPRVTEEQENEARRNGIDPWANNARFIASAPELVRDLMAEVERLRVSAYYVEALEAKNHKLMAEVERLRGGLRTIASQKQTHECEDDEGDFEYAYDMCISAARAALKGGKP